MFFKHIILDIITNVFAIYATVTPINAQKNTLHRKKSSQSPIKTTNTLQTSKNQVQYVHKQATLQLKPTQTISKPQIN